MSKLEVKLIGNFDAPTWAEEFVKRAKANPNFATDGSNMLGWFANALMTGYDYAYKEMENKK